MPILNHVPKTEEARPLTIDDGEALLARVNEIHAELLERIRTEVEKSLERDSGMLETIGKNIEMLDLLRKKLADLTEIFEAHAHDRIRGGPIQP